MKEEEQNEERNLQKKEEKRVNWRRKGEGK
jgi:hypothetical protein